MAEEAFPPLVLELRARGAQLFSELGKVKSAVTETVDETGKKTKQAASGFEKMAGAGKAMAVGIVGAGVVVGGAALKMGMDFQESMTTLVTGAGESEKNIGMVGDGILAMSGKVGQSGQALASGMYLIESAGYHGADGLKVLQAAAEGAKVGNADMKVVADGVTTTLTDYHLKATDAADVTSKLVTTVASGKTTMEALSGSLSNVLPTASAAKVGLDQVLGAMATMTGEGISADQASQDLANTIRSLSAPSEVASKAMAQIGINSTDLAANLGKKGLTGTMDEVYQAIMHNMGPSGLVMENSFNQSKLAAQSAKTMIEGLPPSLQKMAQGYLAGTVSQKQWTSELKGQPATVANLGKQFATTVKQATGFADALKSGSGDAKTFNDVLSKVMGGATGMNTALALTGDNMATFQANVDGIGKASAESDGSVKGFAETQKDLKVKLENAKDGVLAMVTGLGEKLIPVVTKVLTVATTWGNWLGQHKPVLIAVAGIIGTVVVAAVTAYAISMASAAVATIAATWPILAIIAAVALVATAIYEFATHWHQIWDAIKSVVSAVWDWIKDAAGSFASAVFTPIEAGLHFIESVWHTVWGGISAAFDAVTSFISDHSAMIVGFIAIIAFPISLIIAAVHFLWKHWQEIWGAITSFMQWAYDSVIKPVGDWIVSNVLHPIGTGVSWLGGVWSAIWNGIGAAAQWVYGNVIAPIGSAIGAVFNGIASALSWLGGVWSDMWNSIGSALEWVYNHTIGPIVNMIGGAIHGVMSAVNGISNAASSIGHFLGFDNGGRVPGPKGKPMLAVVHGGEYVLSNEMQAGRQAVDDGILTGAQSANGYTPTGSTGSPAPSGGSTAAAPGGGSGMTVNVYAQTNADPYRIAKETGWALRAMA